MAKKFWKKSNRLLIKSKILSRWRKKKAAKWGKLLRRWKKWWRSNLKKGNCSFCKTRNWSSSWNSILRYWLCWIMKLPKEKT